MKTPVERITEFIRDDDNYKRTVKDVLEELRARIYQDGSLNNASKQSEPFIKIEITQKHYEIKKCYEDSSYVVDKNNPTKIKSILMVIANILIENSYKDKLLMAHIFNDNFGI